MSRDKNPVSDNLGKRLQKYRKEKGKTGGKFAELIGISQGSLSDIETGKTTPSSKAIYGLLRNTDIDIKWLFLGEESKNLPQKNNDLIDEIREWAEETGNGKNLAWFKNQFDRAFPDFVKWRIRREELQGDSEHFPLSKIA